MDFTGLGQGTQEALQRPPTLPLPPHPLQSQQAPRTAQEPVANDPSAGSPTETLLRLLLPLSDKVHQTSYSNGQDMNVAVIQIIYRITQSVGATGGVYKGQGHNQYKLMTCSY